MENSACLKYKVKQGKTKMSGILLTYEIYSITDKGKALLQNWRWRQDEQKKSKQRHEITERVINIVIGVLSGIVATIICTCFLKI